MEMQWYLLHCYFIALLEMYPHDDHDSEEFISLAMNR